MSSRAVTAVDADFLDKIDKSGAVLDLHRSNLLQLQMTELVNSSALDLDSVKWGGEAVQAYVSFIRNLLENDLPSAAITLCADDSPFAVYSDVNQSTIQFNKRLTVVPTGCYEAGMGLTKTYANANVLPTLDLSVILPNHLFEEKDYLRHRYFDKRNAVAWHVAKFLSQKQFRSTVGTVKWRLLHHADKRRPTLLLVPPVSKQNKTEQTNKKKRKKEKESVSPWVTSKLRFRVELHFGMESLDWIPPLRLAPNRCNLRDRTTSHYYNYLLGKDAEHALERIDANRQDEFTHWNSALILVKIWCLQRGLLRRHDGFTTEHLGLLILYLYRTKRINPRTTPQQILAVLFKLLAETQWLGDNATSVHEEKTESLLLRKAQSEAYQEIRDVQQDRAVIVLPLQGKTENQTIGSSELANLYARQTKESPLTETDPPTLMSLYAKTYTLGPVFLDPTMRHNFFGGISPAFIRSVVLEAKNSLECLNAASVGNPFSSLFMVNARFWRRYDGYIHIPLERIVSGKSSLWKLDRDDLGDFESIARGLDFVLRKALGNRIYALQLLSTGNGDTSQTPLPWIDSDEIPFYPVGKQVENDSRTKSGIDRNKVVLGFIVNPEASYRIVDRGPPADDVEATKAFIELWGKEKAELRRFQDGAIVHAVVWGNEVGAQESESYVRFQNDDKVQGGIVERIVRHIISKHFVKKPKSDKREIQFSLRNVLSVVDNAVDARENPSTVFNPIALHRSAIKAFESLSSILRKHSIPSIPVGGTADQRSRLGIPLTIDAVEALSPALRYAELYPPIPHPLLGAASAFGTNKVTGAIESKPIVIQIRFGQSSKWPADFRAIGAAKTAMLLQLIEGIKDLKGSNFEECDGFEGPMTVTPTYADIGFMGYVFRIYVRADPEIKMLRGLCSPSPEAISLLKELRHRHVVCSMHHSIALSVHTSHPSSSTALRLAQRWVSGHMLCGYIPFEAVELMIMSVYSDKTSPLGSPGTAVSGFLRFLDLLASHGWEREPLIVDPQGHMTEDERNEIESEFERIRGPGFEGGPALYIISPADKADDELDGRDWRWRPSFTTELSEWVVLRRATELARRTYSYLHESLRNDENSKWSAAFEESASAFQAYSAVLRVDKSLFSDTESSSRSGDLQVQRNKDGLLESSYTRCMTFRYKGPKELRLNTYKNLMGSGAVNSVLLEWRPVDELVQNLRSRLGHFALFFYNDLCPEVIGVVWRPLFTPHGFSAITSEFVRPVSVTDSLVALNIGDVMRALMQLSTDIVVDCKIFDMGPLDSTRKRKLSNSNESGAEKESDSEVEKD